MKKFEYLTERSIHYYDLEESLNEKGDEGWELVYCDEESPGYFTMILKREKS